jgi:hypothetical protein
LCPNCYSVSWFVISPIPFKNLSPSDVVPE